MVRQSFNIETKKMSQLATSIQSGGLDVASKTYDAFVLDAALRQSLVSIRSLGRHDLAVAALEAEQSVPAFSSRWCQQGILAPAESGTMAYLDFVEKCLERTKARVLITSSDSTIALIRQHRKRLEKHTAIALAQDPALAIAINKEQTLEIASQLGLRIPHGVTVRSLDDVTPALREIGLPAVIKPIESWLWDSSQESGTRVAARLVMSATEARIAVEELTHLGGTTLFQQFLTGRREAISLLYAEHEVHAGFAQWAKRTEPQLGGTSVLRQSIALPADTGKQAEHLVRAIGLEGYSEVEFRRDSTGVPFLMEINPRLSASVEIAVRSGVDFPYLLYQWAAGERIDTIKSYRVGGWMRYLKGDIMTTIEAVQQRGRPGITPPTQAVFGFALSCLKPMHYDGVDWHDLAPAIQATTKFTRDWVGGAVLKRLSRLQRSFP